jgi:hypothetical protein
VSTTIQDAGRQVALEQIRVPENVRALDEAHIEALAGSIALPGMLVPVVVRSDGDAFELVAGFHRIAAARTLGLAEVPVVVREAETEDADRAVENITSCRRRHDVINADRVVMPMSELKCPTARCEPGGEVGIRARTDPGSQAAADDLAYETRARDRHPATRSRFVHPGRLPSGRETLAWRRKEVGEPVPPQRLKGCFAREPPFRSGSRPPRRLRRWRPYPYSGGAGADESFCQRPKSFPWVSLQTANQPIPGTGRGSSASPPSSRTRAAPALISSTSK